MKAVFIAEKPSVAAEFAKALKLKTTRRDGYMESENSYMVRWSSCNNELSGML